MAASAILKSLCPKLFHVTCVAHFLHNCTMKVKPHFEDVNQLIAKVKSATVTNKSRQAKFATVGSLPQPIVIKWGSWLNAALCYAKNLHEGKAIVEVLQGLVF